MELKAGQIVKNLVETEPVEIRKIMDFGDDLSIEYTGINTQENGDVIKPKSELKNLEFVSDKGSFNFSGDPVKFALYTEAERIRSAFQFDPLLDRKSTRLNSSHVAISYA